MSDRAGWRRQAASGWRDRQGEGGRALARVPSDGSLRQPPGPVTMTCAGPQARPDDPRTARSGVMRRVPRAEPALVIAGIAVVPASPIMALPWAAGVLQA